VIDDGMRVTHVLQLIFLVASTQKQKIFKLHLDKLISLVAPWLQPKKKSENALASSLEHIRSMYRCELVVPFGWKSP
jgi:hypothetical protein